MVLDGTYSMARRQLRHLQAMLAQYNAQEEANQGGGYVPVKLPVVKLLLGEEGACAVVLLLCVSLCDAFVCACVFRGCLCHYGYHEAASRGQNMFHAGVIYPMYFHSVKVMRGVRSVCDLHYTLSYYVVPLYIFQSILISICLSICLTTTLPLRPLFWPCGRLGWPNLCVLHLMRTCLLGWPTCCKRG